MNDTAIEWLLDPEDTTPIWFLDVDGVINVFGQGANPKFHAGKASPGAGWRQFPITWDPEVIGKMRVLHESDIVRIVWLTTWGSGANQELRNLIGFPELEVIANEPSGRDYYLDGIWWKWHWVKKYVEQSAADKFVWTDDDLRLEPDARSWAMQNRVFAVGPDQYKGLTLSDLTAIQRFLVHDSDSMPAPYVHT